MENIISVIVPVYNTAQYLRKCLNSIIDQTYKKLEIIVINDGSTDNSAEILEEYASKDARIKVVHQENGGLSKTRNVGLSLATGDYVSFVDSDDWIETNMYELMIATVLSEKANVVINPFAFHFGDECQAFVNTNEKKVMSGKEAVVEMLKGELFSGHVCNKIFDRHVVSTNMFDESVFIYEDILAVWDVLLKCDTVVWVDQHSYHYIMNPASIMHRKYDKRIETGKKVAEKILCESTNISDECRVYARLFGLRMNQELCKRSYYVRKESKNIYTDQYEKYCESVKQYYDKNVKEKCGAVERAEFFFASKGLFLYGLWRKIYDVLQWSKRKVVRR